MTWFSRRLEGEVWSIDGLRHAITEWYEPSNPSEPGDGDEDFMWDTLCGIETRRASVGADKPRTFKGFVTCLQCLAKEVE